MADRIALCNLQNYSLIVIGNSDKCGVVVVMDTTAYHAEAIRQLSNQNTYTKLRGDPTRTYKVNCITFIQKGLYLGIFSIREAESLVSECPILLTFHHLPKTHKGLDPLYGRPIVAGIGSLIEKLGQWLDGQLQSLVRHLPSFLKDTNHLLNAMKGVVWRHDYVWVM